MSKVVLKYQVSMLTSPSFHPAYPKIHFRILRTLNPLSQLHINQKFEKYISVSICHCHRVSFMRSFIIAFKNKMNGFISWQVSAPQCLFHFIAWVSFLSISLFFLIFCCSPLLAEVLRFNKTYNKVVMLFLGS